MRKLLLGLLTFLIIMGSVKAVTYIDDCTYINVSDTYKLNATIHVIGYCDIQTACIFINASDVILDFDGYGLLDEGGCQYGVQVLAKDPNPLIQWSGLVIKNGFIRDFNNAQIRVQGSTTGMYIYGMNLTGTGSQGIMADGLNTNMQIQTNYIDTGSDYSVFLSGYSGRNTIQYNSLYSWDGIYLSGLNFVIEGNWIGSYYDNNQVKQYTTNTSCIKEEIPTDKSITLDTVYNASIRKNRIISDTGITLHDAENVNITQNEWLILPNNNYVTEIDSGSSKVAFCSNIFTRTINSGIFYYTNAFGHTLYSYCYWSKYSSNVYNFVNNLGSSVTLNETCTGGLGGGCIIGYYCKNNNLTFVDSTCNIVDEYLCQYGCQDGKCIGDQSTPTTTTIPTYTSSSTTTIPLAEWNITYNQPIVSTADLNAASLGWLTPFLTPFVWIFSGLLIAGTVLTALSKNVIVFPMVIIIGIFILGVYHIVDWGIAAIILLPSFAIIAALFKKVTVG